MRHSLKTIFISMVVAIVTIAWTSSRQRSLATSVEPMSDDDMIRHSLLIVDAKVIKTKSEWNANHTQIHTTVDLEINEFIKGGLPQGRKLIQLRILGGVVGDIAMVIVDAPQFRTGERAILFLRPNFEKLEFPIVGFNQGRLVASSDPLTGKLMIPQRGIELQKLVADLKQSVTRIVKPDQTRAN